MNNVRERTILEEGDVKITNRRVVIGPNTYPLTDLISVGMTKDRTAIGCAIAAFVGVGILLGLFSLISEVYNSEYCLAGIISLGAAVVVALLAPPNYILQIRSMSGKAEILRSMDEDYLKRIVDAINNALIRRA
jgi:hypothetical protein